eukprot:gnl/MRDRNA2_/MRDRNA2_84886_c0_seq2.p1 gnl/MRDRNA2_/MRDRNA2_84886_c0~~gnl/MRDRNA2_/MRDRNA2_84886_c0_seq2.p1  ORF type:complete len:473 (+),score=80.60 gnl/MRDRNA2_/MRDRNA2_84886_c0_seq2:94-1512(+)
MKLIQSVKRKMANSEKDKGGGPAGNDGGAPTQKGKPAAGSSKGAVAKVDDSNPFAALPKLRESSATERAELFRKKMQACSIIFDFHRDSNQRQKEAKRQTLLEIVEYVNNTRNCFNESLMQDVVQMVGSNIFRAIVSTRSLESLYDPEEDEPTLEGAWPHLQIVYEFFLRFVVSNDVDPKIAKRFVDQTFVSRILELFDSEDPRERDYLKTILHRIYGKFMSLRSFIRRGIQHVFFKVIYECDMHNGIGELLEILGSIINGFALPLKDEHRSFLIQALIPLHKVKSLAMFHQQLCYCMAQFAEKDPRLTQDIILAMLKFWPATLTSKQLLFLNELEEILELMQPPEFHSVQEPLFQRIAQCIMCPHFQVAERTLFLWNNDYIVKLINQNRQQLYPLIIGALYKNSKKHWNQAVHGLTFNVLKLLMEADPALFDECSAQHRMEEEKDATKDKERSEKWSKLQSNYDAGNPTKV